MSVWEKLGGIHGKAATLLIVVFLAGTGTGYFAGRWQTIREMALEEPAQPLRTSRHPRRGYFMHRLETDLNLKGDQKERVRATLRQHLDRMREIRIQMRPQINGIINEARREIRVLLNSEQQQIFDQMVKEFEKRRHERRERWRKRMMHDR